MFYPVWDPTYILAIIGAIISGVASINVSNTFRKYNTVYCRAQVTAAQAAQMILSSAGITDVTIEHVHGSLTDHYSPSEKVLRLSDSVFSECSVAAIGVAAHECGHAIQHKEGYFPLKLRSAAVPISNIGSSLSWPIIILGLILGFTNMARFGVILFSFVVLFQLITLPVEFNASSRAVEILGDQGILSTDELTGAEKVLKAAALTYVAAMFSTILQLLRMLILTRGRSRND